MKYFVYVSLENRKTEAILLNGFKAFFMSFFKGLKYFFLIDTAYNN